MEAEVLEEEQEEEEETSENELLDVIPYYKFYKKGPSTLDKNKEAGNYVFQRHVEGVGYGTIAKELKEKFGIRLSRAAIRNYIQKRYQDVALELKYDPQMRKETTQVFLDTVEQMKKLNERLWNLLDKLENEKENVGDIVAIAAEIRRQVELQNKLLGNIQTATKVDLKVGHLNVTSITTEISKYLTQLENKGIIQIKKEKLE